MRLCFDLSAANDSKITLPLESYTSASEHPYMISSFIFPPIVPHRHTGQSCSASSRGGRGGGATSDWNELYLCHHVNDHSFDYANSEAERKRRRPKRRVIKRRHRFIFRLKDQPCLCWCFINNREGHVILHVKNVLQSRLKKSDILYFYYWNIIPRKDQTNNTSITCVSRVWYVSFLWASDFHCWPKMYKNTPMREGDMFLHHDELGHSGLFWVDPTWTILLL